MASKPELRALILSSIQNQGVVNAQTLQELKRKIDGMDEVSCTQFGKALRSLQYRYGVLRIYRPHSIRSHYGPRTYEVVCTPTGVATSPRDVMH